MADESDARWLNGDELRAWMYLSGLMMKLPGALDSQLQRDCGLSFIEYMVLAMLSETPDQTLRMSDLATATGTSLSRLSHLVSRLEKQDFVHRSSDPDDGRYTLATLTDAGMAKVVASAPGHVDNVRELVVDPLTKAQLKQLATVIGRLFEGIDADGAARMRERLRSLGHG